jgi:hypothetical protein
MEIETIEKQGHTFYGLDIYEIDGGEYAVAASEEEADEAAAECIKDSLWSFKTEFIIEHSKLPYDEDLIEMIRNYQQNKCEDANDAIEALVEDLDQFVEDAIAADGRGHFLAPYDFDEICLTDIDFKFWGQVLGALGLGTKDKDKILLYRVN